MRIADCGISQLGISEFGLRNDQSEIAEGRVNCGVAIEMQGMGRNRPSDVSVNGQSEIANPSGRCVCCLAFLPAKQQVELSNNLMEDALADAAEPFDDDGLAQGVDLVDADQARPALYP